jgi:hypothetical protein
MPVDPRNLSLREVQKSFYTLVTAPEGVAQGLSDQGQALEDLEAWIRKHGPLSSLERLDIYANMYFFRIRDILREEYSKVVACVGDGNFHNLVVDYLVARPPMHPSVRNAGERLPGYIAEHELGVERPWLAELAALERARIEMVDAADSAPLTVDHLRTLTPEDFAGLMVRLIPAHIVVDAQYAVDELWERLEQVGEEDPQEQEPEPAPRQILVWREDVLIYHRALDEDEAALWPLLREGVPFGVICERLAGQQEDTEAAARRAFELLGRWATHGVLVG